MKRNKYFAVLTALVGAGVADYASAHHSFAMFNRNTEVFMSGTVVRWAFNAPHVSLSIQDENGETWSFEGRAPQSLLMSEETPMTGYTIQPGQKVDVVICPLSDGRNGGALGYIHADGKWYRPGHGGCPADRKWESAWYEAGYKSKAEAEAAE